MQQGHHQHQGQHHQQDQAIESLLDPQLMGSPESRRNLDPTHQQSNVLSGQQLDPSWGYDLNLLSHAASHVASSAQTQHEGLPQLGDGTYQGHLGSQETQGQYAPKSMGNGYDHANAIFDESDLADDPMQDFSVFLNSVGLPSDWHQGMPGHVESHGQMPSPDFRFDQLGSGPRPQQNDFFSELRKHAGQSDVSFSHLDPELTASHLEEPKDESKENKSADDLVSMKSLSGGEVSTEDREQFISKLEDFVSVLPKSFVAPSQHSLSRYLEGYVNGFHEHLPFMHIPTLNVAKSAPELVLALAAVGAQYRFENARGIELFYAAKAVVMEQIRRRDSSSMPQLGVHPGDSLPGSTDASWQPLGQAENPYQFISSPMYSANDGEARMEIIRALLLLTAFATWERHRELMREALAFQSILARLVREAGLSETEPSDPQHMITWEEWVKREGDKRTKLIVYCFLNLHSIAWNVPPLILNNEVRLDLPEPADEWKAPNENEWQELHLANNTTPVPFQYAFAKLFSRDFPDDGQIITPLGLYVLIHALIQQIFFARQLSMPGVIGTSLRLDDLSALEGALAAWKAGWKRTPELSLDPSNPNGPVAFTSTALLGLAYIRLHVDLGPCRQLESRDPMQVATALHSTPRLQRSPRLIMALLHSAHALSIPVRLGIDFVAKTETFFWSIQHSLCSLECAFLLSKWLSALPSSLSQHEPRLSEHERKLLSWVKSMLDESANSSDPQQPKIENDNINNDQAPIDTNDHDITTHLAQATANSNHDSTELDEYDTEKMKQLSIAVVRVWAKTFKGNTSWAIVDLIGSALDIYGDMLERDPPMI